MDDLTRERYPHGIPYAEAKAKPRPHVARYSTVEEIEERRKVLLEVESNAQRALRASHRLALALMRWRP